MKPKATKKPLEIIIPIQCDGKQTFRVKRLESLLSDYEQHAINCQIVDSSDRSRIKQKIRRICQRFDAIYTPAPSSKVCNPGHLRNIGALRSRAEYIFFHDVDLKMPAWFLSELEKEAQNLKALGPQAFAMYPCFYLKKNQKERSDDYFDSIWHDAIKKGAKAVEQIAATSSCILVCRQHFLEIGGFDQSYLGYGSEDIDFIHRLCSYYPVAEPPSDYQLDHRSHRLSEQKGFRQYMARYSVPKLLEKKFLLHYWHSRDLKRKYYRLRQRNDERMASILKSQAKSNSQSLFDFDSYLKNQLSEYGFDPKTHKGLWFPYGPHQDWNRIEKASRKLRKLVLRPDKFWLDLLKKRYQNNQVTES